MQRAFSLVELSIVLVILGLLTGGILAGQSLIRAAELRSVTNEFQRYIVATQSFRDKYFAAPGDITDAHRFWTSAGGNGANAACQGAATSTLPTQLPAPVLRLAERRRHTVQPFRSIQPASR